MFSRPSLPSVMIATLCAAMLPSSSADDRPASSGRPGRPKIEMALAMAMARFEQEPAAGADALDEERKSILAAQKALEDRQAALIAKQKPLEQARRKIVAEQDALKQAIDGFNAAVDAANGDIGTYQNERNRWVNALKTAAKDPACSNRPAIFKAFVDPFVASDRLPIVVANPGYPAWHYDIHVVAHQILFRLDPGRYPWVNNRTDYRGDWEAAAGAFNGVAERVARAQADLASRKAGLDARQAEFAGQADGYRQQMEAFEADLSAWKKDREGLTERLDKFEFKVADADLRRAQKAVKNTDTTLKWLSRSLYLGYILTKNDDLKGLSEFTKKLQEPAGELGKHVDKIVELADQLNDKPAAEGDSKGLLDKVKLIQIKNQPEELDRLARKVRELPVGLVSEEIDDDFVVSADLLVKAPKRAEARFKSYLEAMTANIDYLRSRQETLDDAGRIAKKASAFFGGLQSQIERAIPFSGPYAKPLTEFYLELDKLARAYGGLASDCATKVKEIRRALEVEQRRRDNLSISVRTLFGFDL